MPHRDDGSGRCEQTEMLVDQCSGCRGHSDPVVDLLLKEGRHGDGPDWATGTGDAAKAAFDAHPITAQYRGECTRMTKCHIEPGDSIIATRANTWMHWPYCPAGEVWSK